MKDTVTRSRQATAFLAALAIAATLGGSARAAEIRVRAECTPQGAIVTLGDLVDLHCESSSEAERLAQIPLFPAPAAGLRRFVSAREIQDMLLVRGIELINHRFSGARSVLVLGREDKPEATTNVLLAASSPRRAGKKLTQALRESFLASSEEPWQFDFQISEDAARWISAADSIDLRGQWRPTVGRHCFEVALEVAGQTKTLDVVTEVSLPPLVVVPLRAVSRGSRIVRADVRLERLDRHALTTAAAETIEEVVGKEATRTLAAGKPISRSWIREPVLVHRGDIVTVIVRAAGIRVRTQARARDDGADGELVAVESLEDRNTYYAQVSGFREVEVLATPNSSASSTRPHSRQG